ncbi:MAG: bifunctional 4-hydroxy-2-oxoglutarate aldolase/2-dehydro-3-deoxy-phosphogluconate aldolase [Kiritimatiellae bacterium]|nr:bifunctional 4-hydroxy-2-oxoglutarate aldolase/2-dehydro-3-deoxy-phosphogluconate aldolase [Kiritimatiellia bacterium]
MNAFNETIARIGVVPVIKLNHPERDAVPLTKALCAGGVPVAEVTFRASGAERAIRLMKDACPDMTVGAGTVTRTEQIDAVLAAGGQFVVTPGFDAELVAYAQKKNIPIFPGCSTATDYHAALKFGLELIKFFPAEQSGGLAKIKALAAPFPMFKVMPTGGISLKNLGAYLSSPVIAACGGSYMVSAELLEGQRWDEITALCEKSVEIVKEARGHA